MVNENIKIKKATLENINDILNLNQQLFDYDHKNFDKTLDCSWPSNNKKYFKNSITSKNSLALVVVDKEKVIGYLMGSINNAEDYRNIKKIAELDNMFILPQYRKKGIGIDLCKKFFKWAREKGIERVKVIVSEQNNKAISYYKKCGFLGYDLTLEAKL